MTRMITALFISLCWAAPGYASDVCGLDLTANNISINWSLTYSTLAVQVTLTKANEPTCDFWLGFTKGGGVDASNRRMSSGSNLLRYNLYRESALTNILQDNSDGAIPSISNVIAGGFQAGTNLQQTLIYYVDIPYGFATSPTLVPSGVYTDSYTINIYEGSDPTVGGAVPVPRPVGVTITTTVPAMIGVSLVGTGGSYGAGQTTRTANMGSLTQGASVGFDFKVRTNAGFSVTFSSANNGNLKSTAVGGTATVPYLFYANSGLLDLSTSATTPVVGLTGSGQTSLEGLGYPIRAVIGNVGGSSVLGGPYSDTITISASTTE